MGLEAVEIVMAVEDRFGIAIDDAEAEKIGTPGLLIDFVMSKVGYTDHAQCLTQRAFHRLRASLMRKFGLKRNQIKPATLLTDLFSRKNRREQIQQILDDLGIVKPIELVRPGWLHKTIVALIFAGGAIVWFFPVTRLAASSNILFAFATTGAPVLFMVAWGWLLHFLTRSMKLEFKSNMKTVGHFSRWVLAFGPDVIKTPPGEWGREQVAEAVKAIVVGILGCGKEYREDAQFVKDLGMG
jgi:hypothetical protein